MKICEMLKRMKTRKMENAEKERQQETEIRPDPVAQDGIRTREDIQADILPAEGKNAGKGQNEAAETVEYELPEETKAEIAGMCEYNENIRKLMEMSGKSKEEVEAIVKAFAESADLDPVTAARAARNTAESVLYMADQIGQAMRQIGELLIPAYQELLEYMDEVLETVKEAYLTEAQKERVRMWRRYYEERTKMSNNKRRMKGKPMVRRPKKIRRKKPHDKSSKRQRDT